MASTISAPSKTPKRKDARGGSRPKAGRKPLPGGPNFVLVYTCKLSMAQSTWLEQNAFDLGITPSAMVRKLIDEKLP